MSKTTKALLIAAVAVMLVGATNAYGYEEGWDGWFTDGYLDCNDKTYDYVEGDNVVDDSTNNLGTVDLFYRLSIPAIAFVCAAGWNDSIFVYIATFTGEKEYGLSGTHDGSGFWTGSGYSDRAKTTNLFDFGGTWEATFDYTPLPENDPIYEGTWLVTWSWPVPVGGIGSSSGERTYYIP